MKTSSLRHAGWIARSIWILVLLVSRVAGVSADAGSVRGVVTDSSQGTFVEGAVVTVADGGAAATTDRRGEFVLTGLPPGEHELRVTFTGLATQATRVRIAAAQIAEVAIELKDDVVRMGPYSVISNRSADALALTEQRHAPNLKNVVDIQSYGRLNNDNPAELLQLLPGVFGSFFAGEVDRVTIRGISDALNNVQLDGNPMATPAINGPATERASVLSTTNANNIKTAEVIKALTPDRPADAIGGMVNLIQRTALDYPKSAGRFQYLAGGQYVTTDSGWDTRVTPVAQITYHDAFGPKRNWGVYLTGGINQETTNQFSTNQTVVNNPTFGVIPNLFSTTENDRYRYRKNWAGTFNYRPRPDHEFVAKYKHDEWFEETESFVTQSTPASPTASWTRDVRTYNSNAFVANHPRNPAAVKTDSVSLDGSHRWAAWEANYGVFASRSIARVAADTSERYGTVLATLLPTVRFTYAVDSTRDFAFPSFRITSGNETASYNPDNYTLGTYQQANFYTDDQRKGAKLDVKRTITLRTPIRMKAGVARNEQSRLRRQRATSHQFLGEDRILGVNPATGVSDDRLSRFADPSPPLSGTDASGNRRGPFLSIERVARSYREQPQLWNDDVFTNTVNSLVNNFQATETIRAAYGMADADFGKLRLLGGVRWERTDVEGTGVFRNPVQATAAQIPDPVQRAINNAGGKLTRQRTYDDWFPSIHASFTARQNLLLRASYSTGIGRQGYGAIIPTTTINDAMRVVTTNNTALRPQHADSYDLSAEYYIEPAGVVSLGLFRKDIRDYVVTQVGTVPTDSDLGAQYAGYELRTQTNSGTAKVEGIEFNYVQQLNFIPRAIGLFTLKGNLTVLRTEGNFGGASNVAPSAVPNFVPRAWNVIGEFTRGKFFVLARYNRQASFLFAAGATPAMDNISAAREKLDVNLVYRWRKGLEVFLAVDNVTNQFTALRVLGRGDSPFTGQVFSPQRRFNFGVQGRF